MLQGLDVPKGVTRIARCPIWVAMGPAARYGSACQVPKTVKDMARRFEQSQRTEVKRSLEMEVPAVLPW